jgi:hypothetical protein
VGAWVWAWGSEWVSGRGVSSIGLVHVMQPHVRPTTCIWSQHNSSHPTNHPFCCRLLQIKSPLEEGQLETKVMITTSVTMFDTTITVTPRVAPAMPAPSLPPELAALQVTTGSTSPLVVSVASVEQLQVRGPGGVVCSTHSSFHAIETMNEVGKQYDCCGGTVTRSGAVGSAWCLRKGG